MGRILTSLLVAGALTLSSCTLTTHFGQGKSPKESYKPPSSEIKQPSNSFPHRDYTPLESSLLMTMIACQYADYYTTKRGLDAGLKELNPLLGENPSDEKLRNFKIASILLFALGGYFDEGNRKFIYSVGAGSGCAGAMWNDYKTRKDGN